jgi:spore coat polysaccharide biosynthesis predicted glycosyltransferase SpsG
MTIVLIADGAPAHGLGHLGRSSAIAVALRARGCEIATYAYGAPAPRTVDGITWKPYAARPAGAVVLDTYAMPAAEQAALAPVAVLHDIGALPPGTRLVFRSGNLREAPLRPPFWGLPEREVREHVERVLITTGGGSLQDAGVAIARDVRAATDAEVALVRGPHATFDAPDGVELVDAPASLLDEMLAADVVITAAGQTSLESVATGAATIALPLVENQRRNADALAAAAAAIIGDLTIPGYHARVELARRGQAAVDGFGALRIAFKIARL